jgi:AraC family transcriptional regulator
MTLRAEYPTMQTTPSPFAPARGSLTAGEPGSRSVRAQALDWPGIILEAGRNDIREVDDVALPHHFLGMNVSRAPAAIELRTSHGFRRVELPPYGFWFSPAQEPFTMRLLHRNAVVRLSVDPARLGRLTAEEGRRSHLLRQWHGPATPQLAHLVRALTVEARRGTPSGLVYVEALATAIGVQLVLHAGERVIPSRRSQGGLSPAARRRVLELMHARLNTSLSVEELAHVAGLSPAHFSRAFRETIGHAPHQYLVLLRLRHARWLLDRPGARLADVAHRSGFVDQAHFTRHFKRQFGATPGQVVRALRGSAADLSPSAPDSHDAG